MRSELSPFGVYATARFLILILTIYVNLPNALANPLPNALPNALVFTLANEKVSLRTPVAFLLVACATRRLARCLKIRILTIENRKAWF